MKPKEDKEQPKAASAAKKSNSSKVFDVSRPGKTPATPTSKPVISGHRPEAQAAQISVSGVGESRPLLNRRKIEINPLGEVKASSADISPEDKPSGASTEPPKPTPTQEETEGLGTAALDSVTGPPELHQEKSPERMSTSPKLKIEPISEPEKPAEEAEKPSEEKTDEPAESKKEDEAEESKPEAEAPAETEAPEETEPASKAEPELSDKELPVESSSMPDAEPVEKPEEGKEEPVPEPVIEPLFDDSGSVVVSNHEHHHHNHGLKVFLLLLLILLLAVAALDVLLDLGILTIEGIPQTDFL